MLIELRVANFRSFNEEQTISLVASKRDDAHPDNLIVGEKFNLLKAAAIYGPNASGKSNLIRAIRFMEMFILNSATRMNQGDKIRGITPFRLSLDSQKQPSSFEVTIVVDNTRYEYGFSATADRVHDEWLIASPPPPQKRRLWFERRFDHKTNETQWVFRNPFKKADEQILKENTRDNGLVLSRGAELNIKPLHQVFMWFRKNLWVFDLSAHPIPLIQRTAQYIKEDQAFLRRVSQMIRHADLGIDGLDVTEESVEQKKFQEIFSRKFLRELGDMLDEEGAKKFSVQTTHHLLDSEGQELFDFELDESNGTQRFFALCGPFLDALDRGAVVVVDELECSMHPLLTRKLIELFQSAEASKSGAQLIFATHDSTLMDPELFRRDQIWLVEKNRRGASELFSLYDFDTKDRPRNTEVFQRNYLAGRYGGVPKFGPTFEDLEFK